ncbi:MAG: MBL fold metallo-hydrolase [Clostridia bacterium]|nr:MBL fold metallo-hydrolase [Clostridia bacterium]
MYELIKVSDNCYYIQSPAKVGIVKISDSEVCLIDSGSDKDAAKKVLAHINANGWTLSAIYNTHSHADHIGGNKLLSERTGCKIFAPGMECDFTNHPILEPAFLYGGNPFAELRHKFLMAGESKAEPLTDDTLPSAMTSVSLAGHSFDMVGFHTVDDIVYVADSLSSKETLDKYKIGFIYDVGAYLETLEKLKTMNAKLFIPSHAEPTDDIAPLAQYNIDAVNEIADKIVSLCQTPVCFEMLLQKLFDAYGLTMSHQQYVLVGSTVRSYLTWLKTQGRLEAVIENNSLTWKAV